MGGLRARGLTPFTKMGPSSSVFSHVDRVRKEKPRLGLQQVPGLVIQVLDPVPLRVVVVVAPMHPASNSP